jgi:DMSO/TMAO reductase YedYZ heme-binding membrane subunit
MLANSRFYILIGSLLFGALVVAWLRLTIPGDTLFIIRTSQVLGLLSIMYWYVTLVISPLGHIIGRQRLRYWEFARRAIGVSAFFFALGHGLFAFFSNLGGFSAVGALPEVFKWSLAGGTVALFFLGLMAVTSFDVVVRKMTYKKWKWLQRLGYIAGILVILHIWSLGSHMVYLPIQTAAFVALLLLFGLELFRIAKGLNQTYLHLDKFEFGAMVLASWAVVGVLIFMLPQVVQNYHDRHSSNGTHECSEATPAEGSHNMRDGSVMSDEHEMTEAEQAEECK